MKKYLKKIAYKVGLKPWNERWRWKEISLKPCDGYKGDVLLSYLTEPFFLKGKDYAQLEKRHTSHWECFQMAQTFLNLGYCVDVIHALNNRFVPKKDYSFFIDKYLNLERIGAALGGNCKKIMHIDGAHWMFQNKSEYERLLALQKRKGVVLPPIRQLQPNWGFEYADFATILGNSFTLSTYSHVLKPMFRIPVTSQAVYPWQNKKYDLCRKNFLWLGSGGLVHKGLDITLDTFSALPDYHLTVCAPIHREKAFEKAYYKELYETPNIHTIGWVDVNSPEFIDIVNKCVGLIYPSCSEGQSGGVVTCMHAGLIPVISYESGVDVNDFGVILEDCSSNTIKKTLQEISSLPTEKLAQMSRKAWEFARTNHTREKFAEEYKKAITQIIEHS